MNLYPNFEPRQIVALEHEDTCLYAEVIQVITSRRLCWVRPLLLSVFQAYEQPSPIYDLRDSADLLWPIALFRFALDTEVIGLLATLLPSQTQTEPNRVAQQQLNQFIYRIWQARPSAF